MSESDLNQIPSLSHSKPRIVGIEYSKILLEYESLARKSKYRTSFDYSIYGKLEERSQKQKMRGGITFKSPLKLANSHSSCQQCLYSFELDTYGRGCFHDCSYCYAKAELIQHGFWNNPMPAPVNINQIWKIFYTVFETDRPSKWRSILEKKSLFG